MTPESLPSGVLKVADLLNEARIEGDSRYTLRTSAVAFAKGAEFALNIARRYLASPPPQATGAPQWLPIESAPKDRRLLGIVDGEVRVIRWGKTSHVSMHGFCLADQGAEDFDLCEPARWMDLPAASQVEPEDKP